MRMVAVNSEKLITDGDFPFLGPSAAFFPVGVLKKSGLNLCDQMTRSLNGGCAVVRLCSCVVVWLCG